VARGLKPPPPKDTSRLKDAVLLGFAEHSQEWLCHWSTIMPQRLKPQHSSIPFGTAEAVA